MAASPSPCLETILSASDLSALILSHLSIDEAVSISLVSTSLLESSRGNAVWKVFWERRWNKVAHHNHGLYEAYQRAFQNPHDLWILHENIVWPWEGLVAGRCGIRMEEDDEESHPTFCSSENSDAYCPTCRLQQEQQQHNKNHSTRRYPPPQTRAQAMAEATRLVQRKLASSLLDPINYAPPCSATSRAAFLAAGTRRRTIDARQYTISHQHHEHCHFLKDLLFFNVT